MLQSKVQFSQMDRKILIQSQVVGKDASNDDVQRGWATAFNPWAKVEERSGSEPFESERITAITYTDFTIRYVAGLNEEFRIVYDNRIYNISKILYDQRKRFVTISGVSGQDYVEDSLASFSNDYSDDYSN